MSIPANKADKKTKALEVKLKRTNTTRTGVIKDGVLEFGEPLYNNADSTLQVGDGQTTVENLKVVKFVTPSNASTTTYYTRANNGMATLKTESGDEVAPKTKFWTTTDSNGNSIDSSNREVVVNFGGGNWFTVDPTTGSYTSIPASGTVVPRAQKIPVSGVTASDKVTISMCPNNSERGTISNLKQAEKTYGTIYAVDSYDGGIYVYCKKYITNGSCHLTVMGG